MEGAGLEAGTYTLVNVRLPQWVIDTKNGLAHTFSQWDVQTPDGVSWHIRNIASGRYLGLAVGEHVRNILHVREVDHQFAWHLQRYGGHQHQFIPYVPNTRHRNEILYVFEDGQGAHQAWHFPKDLHLETPSTLTGRQTYKILNALTHTAITVKDDGSVASFRSDNREGQMQADGLFRNLRSDKYLGIPHTLIYPDDSPRLSSIAIEFTWMVMAHHEGGGKFKFWLPFTHKVLDLDGGRSGDDTPIHIAGTTDVEHIWWRFQEIPTPQQAQANIEPPTGERGPEE
ncbi:hypothetical protein BKA70DRAFT_1285844 [Coprinopsis sp. MPI-PUGE-AT-0042]|nr:hypothetical protein BKA70DRAFT_1285844 [Coprinopsis sp. MPI-PUGE-AT-0042]